MACYLKEVVAHNQQLAMCILPCTRCKLVQQPRAFMENFVRSIRFVEMPDK